jgi:hypothetical protein
MDVTNHINKEGGFLNPFKTTNPKIIGTSENLRKSFLIGFFSKYKFHVIFTLIFITYIILIKYIFKKNPLDVILKYNDLSIVASIIGGFIILLLFLFFKKREELFNISNGINILNKDNEIPSAYSFILKIFGFFLILILITGTIYLMVYLFQNIPIAFKVVSYILNIIITLGIIALIYKIIVIYILKYKKNTDKAGFFSKLLIFFIDLIFYIPCLITDFIEFLKVEYKITTKTEIILFFSVLFLFILKIFLPKITFNLITHKGLNLTNTDDLYYLDEENNFNEIDQINNKNDENKYNKIDYNFGLSSWFYLEAQPPYTNNSYINNTNIISYGNGIKLECNPKNNEMIISAKFENEYKKLYTTKIPYQKWSNVIFNYNGGILDIFIDNKLVSSTKNVVPYMIDNNIMTGKHNGIQGFIKNIIYFKNRLTKNEINLLYNYEKQ